MQFPIDLHLGSVVIPSHFIFNILAVALATRYYLVLRKRSDTLPKEARFASVVGGFCGGLLGARLLDMAYVAPTSIFDQVSYVSYLFIGGKTIVGALIGGIIGVEIAKWIKKETRSAGDMFTFPLIYGIIIGRVGCFLTGVADDTAGLPSSLPWAFDQGDGIPRHPTALYEILFLGIVWCVLAYICKRYTLRDGVLFRTFIVSYLAFRFFVDFIKPGTPLVMGLTAIQIACAVVAVWYTLDVIRKQFLYGRATI